jgi:hypothetical protein
VLGIYGAILLGGLIYIAERMDDILKKIAEVQSDIRVVGMRITSINVELANYTTLCEDIKSLTNAK